jgi:hypothetical protein
MSLEREERHLPILISICFAGNLIFGGLGSLFPQGYFWQIFSWQCGSLLFLAGAALYAAKLATERWHISSAGFILLSIGQGLFFALQNSNSAEEFLPGYASGIMAFIPGMLFLCYYSGFPVWLRVYNLVAMLPFVIVLVKIDMKSMDLTRDMKYNMAGFFMTQVAGVLWSYYSLRPYQKRNDMQESPDVI